MIFSISHRFIFVRNWKTAGSSIREVLRCYQPFYRKNRYIEYMLRKSGMFVPQKFRLLPVHADARTIRDRVGHEIFNQYFKFGFVRNPWDWQGSLYFFILKKKRHYLHRLVSRFKTLDDYVKWHVTDDKSRRLQKDFFSDADGKIIVNFIGRFENLDEDFNYIQSKIGLPIVLLPRINTTQHRDYRTYYSDISAAHIADFYKQDIEFFNYNF